MKLINVIIMINLLGCASLTEEVAENMKVVNRMAVRWEVKADKVEFELSSPEHGWVAIGFNNGDSLLGTHLVMACVKEGKAIAKDYYIKHPGEYIPITELGGKGIVYELSGREALIGTKIRLSLPLSRNAQYYLPLKKGKEYNLLLAYSIEDDFNHHSIMRTTTTIKL